MQGTSYTTRGGIRIQRETWIGPYEREHDTLARTLDDRRGVLLSSSFEFPGRYTRLDMGFVDPPLVLTARGRDFTVEALNARGRVLIPAIAEALAALPATQTRDLSLRSTSVHIVNSLSSFFELSSWRICSASSIASAPRLIVPQIGQVSMRRFPSLVFSTRTYISGEAETRNSPSPRLISAP